MVKKNASRLKNKINGKILIVFLLFLSSFLAILLIPQINSEKDKTIQSVNDIKEEGLNVEVLYRTSSDNVPLKALFIYPQQYNTLHDHSIPLIIFSHGMSSDYLARIRYNLAFAKRGFAVLSVEHRGHGSNPAPSTLGYLESWDIIGWLDYIEDHFEFVNTSSSGIWGHSMGAQYATLAYIFESLGKHRLKALVAGSGPLNLSREMVFLSSNSLPVEHTTLMTHFEEKNPINYVNSSFPNNVMIIHGTNDHIVDYNCSIDFVKKIDPLELTNPDLSRKDVEFYSLEGVDHSLIDSFFAKQAYRWFNLYILHNNLSYSEISLDPVPFDQSGIKNAYSLIEKFVALVIISAVSFLYLIMPSTRKKSFVFLVTRESSFSKQDEEKEKDAIPTYSVPLLKTKKWKILFTYFSDHSLTKESNLEYTEGLLSNLKNKAKSKKHSLYRSKASLLLGYFITLSIVGFVFYYIPIYLVKKLLVIPLIQLSFILLYHLLFSLQGEKHTEDSFKKIKVPLSSYNSILGIVTGALIVIGICSILFYSHSTQLVEEVLVSGYRTSLWGYVLWLYVCIQILVNMNFIRTFIPQETLLKKPVLSLFVNALAHFFFMFLTLVVFLWFYIDRTYFFIPAWFSFKVELVFSISLVFAVLFSIFDVITSLLEKTLKARIPGAVLCSFVLAGFAAFSHYFLFY